MNISTLIKKLEELKKEHGDLDVLYNNDGREQDIEYFELYNYVTGEKYIELS